MKIEKCKVRDGDLRLQVAKVSCRGSAGLSVAGKSRGGARGRRVGEGSDATVKGKGAREGTRLAILAGDETLAQISNECRRVRIALAKFLCELKKRKK